MGEKWHRGYAVRLFAYFAHGGGAREIRSDDTEPARAGEFLARADEGRGGGGYGGICDFAGRGGGGGEGVWAVDI